MDLDDLLKPRKPAGPVIGESLAALSLAELEARLVLIAAERERVQTEMAARKASIAAAQIFFKT